MHPVQARVRVEMIPAQLQTLWAILQLKMGLSLQLLFQAWECQVDFHGDQVSQIFMKIIQILISKVFLQEDNGGPIGTTMRHRQNGPFYQNQQVQRVPQQNSFAWEGKQAVHSGNPIYHKTYTSTVETILPIMQKIQQISEESLK